MRKGCCRRVSDVKYLILNADDFGLAPSINAGIVEAHRAGVVTSSSLMVERPAAAEAAALAHRHPALSIGLHFDDHSAGPGELDDASWIKSEYARQLERFRALMGADPTHVDSHHHVHFDDRRTSTFRRLVAPLGVPLRGAGEVAYLGDFYARRDDGVTDLARVNRRSLLDLVENQTGADFTELGCHPGRGTGEIVSSYAREREAELETLTSPGLRRAIEQLGVRLVSYRARPQ